MISRLFFYYFTFYLKKHGGITENAGNLSLGAVSIALTFTKNPPYLTENSWQRHLYLCACELRRTYYT